MTHIQFIERDGHPEFAIVPIEVWEYVKHLAEDWDDATLFDEAKAKDDGFRIPAAVLDAEMAGDHPIRAWRKYRRLTQGALAKAAGVSKPYLSQIEHRRREGSMEVLRRLSAALGVSIDVLVEQNVDPR